MSKYKIYLTEHEAKMFRALIESTILTSAMKPVLLRALLSIGNKIEKQSDYNTY